MPEEPVADIPALNEDASPVVVVVSPPPATGGDIQIAPESEPEKKEHLYKRDITAFAVMVNFTVGAGILALPYAFYKAGITFSSISLVFFGVLCVVAGTLVLEIMIRAGKNEPPLTANFKKSTYTHWCGVFGGRHCKLAMTVVMYLFYLTTLWAYTAAFGSSLSTAIFEFAVRTSSCNIYDDVVSKNCHSAYYASCIGYGVVVTLLALMGLTEQQLLQMIMTCYRFVVFGLVFITALIALCVAGPIDNVAGAHDQFKIGGFGVMFPTVAVALQVHTSIADALTPMNNKRNAPRTTLWAIGVAMVLYIAVAAVGALLFSPPDAVITLEWANYTGRNGGFGSGSTLWWAYIIKVVIVLFPCFELLNVFPLVVLVVASNIVDALSPKHPACQWLMAHKWVIKVFVCVIPVVLATGLGKVNIIFEITGTFAFFIVFIIPPVFQILSRRYYVKNFGPGSEDTPISTWYTGTVACYAMLVIGAIALVLAVLTLACPDCIK